MVSTEGFKNVFSINHVWRGFFLLDPCACIDGQMAFAVEKHTNAYVFLLSLL